MAYKIIELSCIERENPGKPLQRDTRKMDSAHATYRWIDMYTLQLLYNLDQSNNFDAHVTKKLDCGYHLTYLQKYKSNFYQTTYQSNIFLFFFMATE